MQSERKQQGVETPYNRFRPAESDSAAVSSRAAGRQRLHAGAGDPRPRASNWGWKTVVLGCVAWFLAALGLLVLVSNLSDRPSSSDLGPGNAGTPTAVSAPEGSNQHQ